MSFKPSNLHTYQDGGRVTASGWLQNDKCTLINVHAPNTSQNTVLSSLVPAISSSLQGPIVMGGDFNLGLQSLTRPFWCPPSLRQACRSSNGGIISHIFQMCGAWWIQMKPSILTPGSTVFLCPLTWFRMILIPISPLIISRQSRLNTSLLKNTDFTRCDRIIEFVELNRSSVTLVATIWEAFKATCTGWIIRFSSAEENERAQRKSLSCLWRLKYWRRNILYVRAVEPSLENLPPVYQGRSTETRGDWFCSFPDSRDFILSQGRWQGGC